MTVLSFDSTVRQQKQVYLENYLFLQTSDYFFSVTHTVLEMRDILAFSIISHNIQWLSLRKDVTCYVHSCEACASSKSPRTRPAGLLMPFTFSSYPWTHFSMDFILDLSHSLGCTVV